MIVLGVDPSTKTGIAAADHYGSVIYTATLSTKEKGIRRAGILGGKLARLLEEFEPDLVVFEGYGYANTHSLVTLAEIGTVLRYFTLQAEIEYIVVAPPTLKKFITGKGNAKKDHMMLEVFKRFGFDAPNNDVADAVGLAMYGLALNGHLTLPKSHMDALRKHEIGG